MSLIDRITSFDSLSIVGLEKNTGKTECLNYVLRSLAPDVAVAVTSIGLDGETVDSVTRTPKPEITLRRGTIFATSEADYARRRIVAEILDVGETTATGRVVTARALSGGKMRLSGASSAAGLRRWIGLARSFGARLTIVDGALSRLSSASPTVSRAMILSTGAALSASIPTLTRQTRWAVDKILLPLDDEPTEAVVSSLADTKRDLDVESVEVRGALTDTMLKAFSAAGVKRVVVADFTRLFCSEAAYRAFRLAGGSITVRQRSELVAITVNPTSPAGVKLDSDRLCAEIERATGVATYDIFQNDER